MKTLVDTGRLMILSLIKIYSEVVEERKISFSGLQSMESMG